MGKKWDQSEDETHYMSLHGVRWGKATTPRCRQGNLYVGLYEVYIYNYIYIYIYIYILDIYIYLYVYKHIDIYIDIYYI